jgi:hypothetical protein
MINSAKEQQCILLLSAIYFGLRDHHQVEQKNNEYTGCGPMPILHKVIEGTITDLLSSNCVLDMHRFTATDHQSGSS